MKKESTLGFILRLTVTLLLITGIVAGLLAAVNSVTAPRIAAAKAEKTQKALAAVIPDADTAVPLDSYPDKTGLVSRVYASDSAYAVEVSAPGFSDAIKMMVGVDQAGKVLGISIISHTETPNLGAVAAAENAKGQQFRQQFAGLTGELAVTKDGGQVDTITGATITSRGVTAGVNAAIRCVAEMG